MFIWFSHISKKNVIKSKYTYNVIRIAFDGEGIWSFGNDFCNVVTSGVDNSSSSHANIKNKFLILSEGALVQQKKNLVLTLIKESRNFASACITMVVRVACM